MTKSIQSDKNNTTLEPQQPTDQQDATNPQEYGRSMVEMLGVLAVLGVLSIGGVQGYTYAMNKYRANEIVNELNLLNAQLAMFMNGIHEDEAVMSLGEPYDNGEKINAGGYAFAYGCGQDPESTSPCDLDETGYYMTLTGVPEEVCKSTTQMTANMMNLVEQKVNGTTDNGGILCQDGENEIVLLFDANDGQGFENGDGGEDGEDENSDAPDATLPPKKEETTTTTFETTTPATTTTTTPITDCNISGECCTNNDCSVKYGSGYYCDIISDNCSDLTHANSTCRKVNDDLRDKSDSVPFWMSNRSMTWWSAKNFCSALGKTLVDLTTDYGCIKTWSGSIGSGYCTGENPTGSTKTDIVEKMYKSYGSVYSWTITDYSSCYAYFVDFNSGGVDVYDRNNTARLYAACTDG